MVLGRRVGRRRESNRQKPLAGSCRDPSLTSSPFPEAQGGKALSLSGTTAVCRPVAWVQLSTLRGSEHGHVTHS